jgi:hypothetical protein
LVVFFTCFNRLQRSFVTNFWLLSQVNFQDILLVSTHKEDGQYLQLPSHLHLSSSRIVVFLLGSFEPRHYLGVCDCTTKPAVLVRHKKLSISKVECSLDLLLERDYAKCQSTSH